ncbi:rhodanese-like domain-containing protein [Bradyrhizobium prioriisuperbiae]|uniref:rhodanese-like domain-containing protein n=1 Tax=Bradyrhizobium prioriisuperbiae TaxID=2854389 RepID=UPI0028E47273|nr:rhodanese-like domain-containing protein [Bradyrhizobium prioritasuperba]
MTITLAQLLSEARTQVHEIEIAEAKSMFGAPGVVVLDVRDSKELNSGMIPGAQHAQRGMLEFYLDRESDLFLPALRDQTALVMVCGSGGRATLAARLAADMGWHALVLKGGMKAWRAANQDLVFP